MSLITPNSTISLLNNVPLDSRFLDTFSWENIAAQETYFTSHVKRTFTAQTYARHERGTLRVQCKADDVYDCNYMMFRNTDFGAKWFYAFIENVEYINNSVAEIRFKIDPVQTWYFETSFAPCFVERMHAARDQIGDNIMPEPVDVGEYVYNDYDKLTAAYTIGVVLISIIDVNQQSGTAATADVHSYEGVISGSTLWAYRADDIEGINAKVAEYIQKPDAIIAMYMAPPLILPGGMPDAGGYKVTDRSIGQTYDVAAGEISTLTRLDGYLPKNKKLLTYPYNMYIADNANGTDLVIRYEFCSGLKPRFIVYGNFTQPVEVVLRPVHYKGSGDGPLQTMALSLNGYPMCSWNVDTFKAWVAQNSLPIAGSVAMGAAQAIIGGVTGNPAAVAGGVGSIFNTAVNAVKEGYQASIKPDMGKGNFNTGGANYGHLFQCFYGGRASVKGEVARMIDNFFDAYGYAQKKILTPVRTLRPYWTYIKTAGCVIRGSVPEDDRAALAAIHDNGIRYWKTSDIGNYTLDNSPG